MSLSSFLGNPQLPFLQNIVHSYWVDLERFKNPVQNSIEGHHSSFLVMLSSSS
jgi:hypothetical protein